MLTGIVLCRNASATLPRCLESLKFCDQVIVVDDNSSDSSVRIASSYGARVLNRSLSGDFATQRNFALSRVSPGWALFVDADEVVPEDLAKEIVQKIVNPDIEGFFFRRVDHLWGCPLRNGDLKDFRIIRLAKNTAGKWQGKVHETWQVRGAVSSLLSPLDHFPHPKLYQFLHQLNDYSSIRAKELHADGRKTRIIEVVFYPFGKFVYLYLYKFGIFDGVPGLVHALCMSFYTFLVRGKLYLLGNGIGEYA